jgi:hypothetical protein
MQSSVIYTNSFRTSQGTYYVSATKPNRLMLFRETVAVYCGNLTEHINTLCGQNAELFNIVVHMITIVLEGVKITFHNTTRTDIKIWPAVILEASCSLTVMEWMSSPLCHCCSALAWRSAGPLQSSGHHSSFVDSACLSRTETAVSNPLSCHIASRAVATLFQWLWMSPVLPSER